MQKAFLAICFAFAIAPPAASQTVFVTGNSLLADFKSAEGFGPTYAYGYSVGVFDASEGLNHCAPSGVSQGQIRAIALRYLEANPEVLHQGADTLLRAAYKEAFPCRKR